MKYIISLILCLCAFEAHAQQRIRDFSMPEQESLRQPNTPSTPRSIKPLGGGGNDDTSLQPPVDNGASLFGDLQTPARGMATHFMEGYCDPNFVPMMAGAQNAAAVQACLQQRKTASCTTFSNLPNDVKIALNAAIDCAYAQSEGDGAIDPMACAATAERRLQLLKKYVNDGQSARALIFMPDAVLSDTAQCVNGR